MTTTTSLASLTAATFDETIASTDLPIVVDVWAEWCGPCHMLEPVLATIADEQADRLKVVKINGDDHPEILQRFAIMSLPTMLVFRDGELVNRLIGARGKGRLLNDLADVLA